ncbi:MAG: type II toxin-antitoxin system VapC family toxin [Candidatus Melainabacteria bacterium]
MSYVLDASVALAWLFESEHTVGIIALLRNLEKAPAFVPSLWALEVANTIVVSEKKGRLSEAKSIQFIQELDSLDIRIDPQTPQHALHTTLTLARKENLTAYDAAYLELALRQHCPLATLDKPLREVARRLGLAVLPETLAS